MKLKIELAVVIYFSVICFSLLPGCLKSADEHEIKFLRLHYKSYPDEELNTFENIFVANKNSEAERIKIWLTIEEQNKILLKANKINFFQLPDTISTSEALNVPQQCIEFLRIKYKGLDKKVMWLRPLERDIIKERALLELTFLIKNIIRSKPEYKKLTIKNAEY